MKTTTINTRIAMVILVMAASLCALAAQARTITITLKNGTTITYLNSELDSVRYVGGEWGTAGAIGAKVYLSGSTVSHDFLFSQVTNWEDTDGQSVTVDTPVISPAGGTLFTATAVMITCATSGTTLYYTTDGTNPASSATATSGSSPLSLTVNSSVTIRVVAKVGDNVSAEATATFTYSTATDDNVNANWWSGNWENNNLAQGYHYTPRSAGLWRMEVPRLSNKTSCSWVQKETADYGVTFALEWDNELIANRWVCYQMHAGNMLDKDGRDDDYKEDEELPSSTRSRQSDYSGSGFSRGHMCPSSDRLCSDDQNDQTFYFSNMQPQYSNHNSGQWNQLEGDVRTWANRCDTLYVVKAATIDNVTLNGVTSSGVKSVKCNNRLPVANYFYMALLAYDKSQNKYYAMGIWTYHYDSTSERQNAEYITIDELERRTGIDFFCNLPDVTEDDVEGTLNTSYWSSGASLNR